MTAQTAEQPPTELAFLAGGGEMGERIRAHNWSQTPLGPPADWPQSLKTAVAIMLGASAAIAIGWGEQSLLLYNDAWCALIGDKHPDALGRPAEETFPEVWETIGPLLNQVYSGGGATAAEEQLLRLDRHGQREDAWFDYTYNPIPRADGSIGGVFNIAAECTSRVRAEAVNRQREQQLRQAARAAHFGTYLHDLRGDEHYWSPEFLQIFGLEADDSLPLADSIPAAVHPDDREAVLAEARARSERRIEPTFSSEHRIIRPNGEVRWVLVQGRMTFDDQDRPLTSHGIVVDVTQRKQAEAAQRESERLLHSVLEQMPSGVHVVEAQTGRDVLHNREFERLLGHGPMRTAEYADYSRYGAIHDDGTPYKSEEYPMIRALQGEEIREEQMRYRRGDGTLITLSVNAAPIRAENGAIVRGVVTFHDISQLKRVQEALSLMNETLEERVEQRARELRAQEQRYRTLFDSIDAGFCIVEVLFDDEGQAVDFLFLETNPAFKSQSGLENVEGRRMRELTPELEPYWYETYGRIARTGQPERFTNYAHELANRWYDVYAFRVGKPEERRVAILFNDVTARKEAEKRIHELAAQLTLAEHEERGRIAHILHDDLQQQLYALEIQIGILRKQIASTVGGEELLADIIEMQALAATATKATRQLSVDLSPSILEGEGLTQAIGWLATRMEEQFDLAVEVKAEGSFPVPERDRRVLLFRTVRELLFNAVKHAGVRRATVRLQQQDGAYRIEVIDEGPGFDTEAIMAAESGHDGRGLLHARQRVRLIGGRMEVESAPGRGTRALIVVPPEETAAGTRVQD